MMDQQACSWRPSRIRESPLILWGMDEIGRWLARHLVDGLSDPRTGGRWVRRFEEPEGDPLPALGNAVIRLAEEACGQYPEFDLTLLIAAWAEHSADCIALLEPISHLLDTQIPGHQSLTLTVFLPPLTATAEEKARVLRCFEDLEGWLGTLKLLDAVFVYQFPLDLYQEGLEASATTADLLALLARQCLDANLAGEIRRTGYAAIRNRNAVDGHKAGYSALGAQRLVYFRKAALEHLQARFQEALFRRGLADAANLPAQRALLDQQVEGFRQDYARRFEEQYQAVPLFVVTVPDDRVAQSAGKAVRTGFEKQCNNVERDAIRRLAPFFDQADQDIRQRFDAVLAHDPAYLAGGRSYLERVRATLAELEASFCHQPVAREAVKFYSQWPEALAASFRTPPSTTSPDQDAAEPANPRRALSDSFAVFLAQAHERAEQLRSNQREQDAWRDQWAALPRRYPWYFLRRFRPAEYLREKRAIQENLDRLAQERAQQEESYAALQRFYQGLVGTVLWPQVLRFLIVDGFRQRLDKVVEEFNEFYTAVDHACAARWEQARAVPEIDRWTETTIATPARLDHLDRARVGATPWLEWAQRALAYTPPGLRNQPPSYQGCRNLRDHFHAGAPTLLDRLSDFAAKQVATDGARDALDWIEVGEPPAGDFLQRLLAKTQRLPEFSTGLIPRMEQAGVMKRVRVIRCTPTIRERLRKDYGYLFRAEDCFQDCDDPELIDITTFTFGFPAVLLHVLQQARAAGSGGPKSAGTTTP